MAATMNISLPSGLKDYVKQRVQEGDFSTPSDFVRALIRADKEQYSKSRLEDLLLEGVASEGGIKQEDVDWDGLRAAVMERNRMKP